jgi:hypothetical protein
MAESTTEQRMSVQIGTVEVLRFRIYNTESGSMAVDPGVYPVLRHPDRHVSLMLTGRKNHRTPGSFEVLEPGLFALNSPVDDPTGEPVEFPYGYWSPSEFEELLRWKGATDGQPEQRLRFRLEVSVNA